MWVRKSNEQIARERRRSWLSFRVPILWFLIFFVGGIGIALQGPRRQAQHWPRTWSEILSGAAVDAGVIAIVAYAVQLLCKERLDPGRVGADVVMCDTCHRVKHPDNQSKCECGGTFDDFEKWTWIDGDGKQDGADNGKIEG